MRLPIIIGVSLMLSFGLNMPALSQSSPEMMQSSPGFSRLNIRRLIFNRRLWNQQNISNYRYTFTNGCFCVPEARGPVVIEVRNGQTTSITSATTGEPVANPEFFQQFNTIPKLFNLIQDAIQRKADSLDVSYNVQFGYPTEINIDYRFQVADEELFLGVSNFEVLQ